MPDYFRRHLGAKLFLSYLAMILIGVIVLVVAGQFILSTAFNRHMAGMGMTLAPGASAGVDGVLPATPETYQQIHAEADRLNRLVDDLQELSRLEARAYELGLRQLDVSALVQTVTKRLIFIKPGASLSFM